MRKNSSSIQSFKESRIGCECGKGGTVNGLLRADRRLSFFCRVDSDGGFRYKSVHMLVCKKSGAFCSIRVAPRILIVRPVYRRIPGLFIWRIEYESGQTMASLAGL